MTTPSKTKSPSRKTALVALMIVAIAIPAGGVGAFFGGFSGIVFDPTNFVENVRQAVALLGQIERAATQIRLQQQTLAHLPVSVADSLNASATRWQESLVHVEAESNPSGFTGGGEVQSLYPLDIPGDAIGWLDVVRPIWTQVERVSLIRQRNLTADVQQDMNGAMNRVAVLIQASNGRGLRAHDRPGQVAVLQAQQQLLAHCTGEADKLLALRTLRAKRRAAHRARKQAEASHQRARREALMMDWDVVSEESSNPVSNPFGR